MLKEVLKRFSQNSKAIFLVVLGSISWSLTMVKSGIVYPFGMGFWGANGHDGVWHLSLISSLARGTLEMPVFAGSEIKNYHVGFDLILAIIHRLTTIPVVLLYFQIAPVLLSVLTGVAVYIFVKKWKGSVAAWWAMFFVYFGGDFGWVLTFLKDRTFGGESMFWAQQAVSTLINPPFALSVVLMFLGLNLLWRIKNKFSIQYYLLAILIFGTMFEVKAYAGILSLGALFVTGFYELLREKKAVFLKVFLGSTFVSLIFFLVFSKGSTNPFIFQPFWFLESMIGSSDRLNWTKLAEAMLSYKNQSVIRKFVPAYFLAFIIFWVGNMGTRLFGSLYVVDRVVKRFRDTSSFDIFFVLVILGGGGIPTFFLQQGTAWNTIQFFYYSLVFAGVLGGIFFGGLFRNKIKMSHVFVSSLIIFFTIPTSISTLVNNYIPGRPPAKISNEELSGLNFLSKQNKGIVLTYPFDEEASRKAEVPPRPLYIYASTSYVSTFSDKQVFLEDEGNLDITGFDWRTRHSEVQRFLDTLNQKEARDFLRNNNISYVYWVKPQRARLGESQLGIRKIFENSEVNIYKVD